MNRIIYGATALMMMFSGSALAQTNDDTTIGQAPAPADEMRLAGLPYAEADTAITTGAQAETEATPASAVRFDTPSAMAYNVPDRDYQFAEDAEILYADAEPTRLGRD